jgi:hypothetical protein
MERCVCASVCVCVCVWKDEKCTYNSASIIQGGSNMTGTNCDFVYTQILTLILQFVVCSC